MIYPKCTVSGHVSKEMKEYIENKTTCGRKLMLSHFPGVYNEVKPNHLCCDICSVSCKCDKKNQQYLSAIDSSYKSAMEMCFENVKCGKLKYSSKHSNSQDANVSHAVVTEISPEGEIEYFGSSETFVHSCVKRKNTFLQKLT